MTIQAIQARMPQTVEGVAGIHVDAGPGAAGSFPDRGEDESRFPKASF